VEVDVALTGSRSYPGIVFHLQSPREYEHIYVRPHRAGLYPDAVQYAPTANGISSWQLYNGDGFTAATELPENEWVTVRLEFAGTQARLFIGDADSPVLHVQDLKLGEQGGTIGVSGPVDGSAYFSNFRYRAEEPAFEPLPEPEKVPGTITEWSISQPFQLDAIDLGLPPDAQDVEDLRWTSVVAEPTGLLDIGRHVGRTGSLPDCVFARAVIPSDGERTMRLDFGYSDAVSVYLNGRRLFEGGSAYRQRDPSFLGIIGYFDSLFLPLVEGDNTLDVIVVESFGGWGLMARDGEAVFEHGSMTELGEAGDLPTAESVVYDPARNVFYVSCYDVYRRTTLVGGQFIATLSRDGEVLEPEWVGGLRMPTGMALVGDRLYVVERGGLVEIDVAEGEVVERHELPGAMFPNDVSAAPDGSLYVTDTRGDAIYRFADGVFEQWVAGPELGHPNAVLVDGERLLFGSGDGNLVSVDLTTREMATVARFRSGNIDGIQVLGPGQYLVSHWQGRVYRVTDEGASERLLDMSVKGVNTADFAYVPNKGILAVPTFLSDGVLLYRLEM